MNPADQKLPTRIIRDHQGMKVLIHDLQDEQRVELIDSLRRSKTPVFRDGVQICAFRLCSQPLPEDRRGATHCCTCVRTNEHLFGGRRVEVTPRLLQAIAVTSQRGSDEQNRGFKTRF